MEYNACSPSRVNYFISSLQNFEKEALKSTSFGPLLELANVRTCCSLIYLLIEKYDFANEWFVVGGKRIRFHIYEMAVITGLDVVDRQSKVDKKVCEDEVKLFCCKYFGKKEEITRNEIENILQNLNSVEHLDDFRRLSLLYFLVSFLIPNKKRTISIEYVYMVYDIGEFNNIAWGKIVYDELLKGLKKCSKKFKTYKKHTHLNGCAYALQVWALERIPILDPSSLQSRIPRYQRYSAYLPFKRELYECALRTVDATAEIKVTPEESRITVIRKALNARGLEKNATHLLVKRVRSLEKEVRFLKKGYAELKGSCIEQHVPLSSAAFQNKYVAYEESGTPSFSRPAQTEYNSSDFRDHQIAKQESESSTTEPPKFAKINKGLSGQNKSFSKKIRHTSGAMEWSTRMDVAESGCNYVVTVELPGVGVNSIRVEVDDGNLIVTGNRSTQWRRVVNSSEDSSTTYHRREILQGPYEIVWSLPDDANEDGVSTEFVDGFLQITVPKL